MDDPGYPIRGSAYGSTWQLALSYLLGLEAIFVSLAATHVLGWRPPPVVTVCSPIMASLTQSKSPVAVSTAGVSLSVVTVSVDVPWANIEGIEPRRTGARLTLRQAQESDAGRPPPSD